MRSIILSTISKDDLQNTDLLVFRESTGELVMERRGLRDEEIDGRTQIGEAEEQGNLYYRLMIRGPRDRELNIGGGVLSAVRIGMKRKGVKS